MLALKDAGCSKVFSEVISSSTPLEHRHQLQACLAVLEPEVELVVTKLDRLGRTQVEVINRLHDLQVQGIHIRTPVAETDPGMSLRQRRRPQRGLACAMAFLAWLPLRLG